MATAIQKVRAIIQDQPVAVQEVLVFDGGQTAQRTKYFPITSISIPDLPAPLSVDLQSGTVTYATPPAASNYLANYSFVQLLDSTIQIYLDLETADGGSEDDGDSIRLASALALDAIASSQALILKRIELLDLKTDGPAVAKALRDGAKSLRDLVFEQGEDTFEVIEQINDAFGLTEKIVKDAIREG